ncbi:YeeE/YedE family protein [Marinomonas sp. 15G1-11]|uniref:YeeE/YedE family protein n=1 Tax=Marinomonas phaeophyticola TaxID=3004091 RepID=A0ABT4JPA7_9GAMM|nr:YeeE/YedE family protein [Marinomonas sp. 15G1-11]MCZ2720189.1 YeeE/YedE family protein [Marinomonas sp. 15G1-11]
MDNYISPLIGGLLIGATATFYLLTTGKVLGISGIFSQALFSKTRLLPALFIIGLIIGGSTYGTIVPQHTEFPESRNIILILVSGLLVGYGTRLGSGCTSGHGVCGISRFSVRSIIATITFMVSAVITVYLAKTI